jgi:2-polyprenyl-3-methyl-5-hydroxy-6-metoxy-1,4-benzoquinol methylase
MRPVAPLPPIDPDPPSHCGVCGAADPVFLGRKEFARSGNDHFAGARQFADTGVEIPYHRCRDCGLVFTAALDRWTRDDFARHIYNDDYIFCDPPFAEERPLRNAAIIAGIWHYEAGSRSVLDVGGGNGRLAAELRARGFDAASYDAFHDDRLHDDGSRDDAPPPDRRFGLVCSFEVIEHVPHRDQAAWIAEFASRMADSRMTESRPADAAIGLLGTELVVEPVDIEHWYFSPRNGHITVHTADSLDRLLRPHALCATSIANGLHLIRRTA